MALVLAWKFNTTEMGGPGLTCKVRSSATHVGSVSTTTKPHGTSKAIPENITVQVGMACRVKAEQGSAEVATSQCKKPPARASTAAPRTCTAYVEQEPLWPGKGIRFRTSARSPRRGRPGSQV